MIKIDKPNSPYIIIDTLCKENNTYNGMYIISMKEKENFNIGRSNTNHIIIKDISVSRLHA